jgi:hypothetical protein
VLRGDASRQHPPLIIGEVNGDWTAANGGLARVKGLSKTAFQAYDAVIDMAREALQNLIAQPKTIPLEM